MALLLNTSVSNTSGSVADSVKLSTAPSATFCEPIAASTGASLTDVTLMNTVAVLENSVRSVALYVKESIPTKSWSGS